MGRPSKYKKEYCKGIIDFFDYELVSLNEKNGKIVAQEPKFFTDFAQSIGVSRDTLLEWSNKYQDFSVAYKIAKQKMIDKIVKGGLLGLYNSGVTCFTLKNIAGWRDMSKVEHSGNITHSLQELVEKNVARNRISEQGSSLN